MSIEANGVKKADVILIGAGPIGIETAVSLKQAGVDYLHFEAGQIGHTISWWPRNTRFFSTAERVAIAGVPIPTVDQLQVTGEEYLAYLRSIVEQCDLEIHTYERVEKIEKSGEGFTVLTRTLYEENHYECKYIVLATGGMDKANQLDVPGEDLPHVSHYLIDPHTYFRKRLLVVGGRNSAVEAAMRCWRAGAEVTLSYRRADFDRSRVKKFLLDDIDTRVKEGEINLLMETVPVRISPEKVVLATARNGVQAEGDEIHLEVDFVLLCTGYVADMSLFEMVGVELEGQEQAPQYNPETMETNVPGVFVAGTACGGTQSRFVHFIETSHQHVPKIVEELSSRLSRTDG